MPNLPIVTIQVNSNATNQLQNVINKINTYPNKIQSAQVMALNKTHKELIQKLSRISPNARHLHFSIVNVGTLGARVKVGVPPKSRGKKSYYAALMFIKGRKSGKIIKPRKRKAMKLYADESRNKQNSSRYPEFLKSARQGAMPNNESVIKQTARELIIHNLKIALKRQGFGARGGAPSAPDMRYTKIVKRY